jgi:hypothetical protein
MDYNTIDKIITSFRKHPIRTILIVFIMALVAISAMFLNSYLSELGKGAASNIEAERKKQNNSASDSIPSVHIEQNTKGDKSPAVVSNGNVNIQFENKKGD